MVVVPMPLFGVVERINLLSSPHPLLQSVFSRAGSLLGGV
jgi:hypothetical protein